MNAEFRSRFAHPPFHRRPRLLIRPWFFCLALGLFGVSAGSGGAASAAESSRVLADWKALSPAGYQVVGGSALNRADGYMELRPQPTADRVGVVLAPENGWNLDEFAEIAVPVRNLGASNVRVVLRVEGEELSDKKPPGRGKSNECELVISPGAEPMWFTVALADRRTSPLAGKLFAMTLPPRELVRRGTVIGARVKSVSVWLRAPDNKESVAVGPMVARGRPAPLRDLPAERVFPMIDEFGQFVHRDWPGKIRHERELTARRQQEESDLAAQVRPAGWNRFGGWARGPQLQATGFFRIEKIDGIWWMVDPEGRLFWSHGVVRVGTRVRVGTEYHGTPIADREHYFRLPPQDSPLGAFYDTEVQASRGYYVGRENHAIYDHLEANLFRKYGANWRSDYAAQMQRRLGSWGLNTIANSSDPAIFNRRETPYTAVVYSAPLGRSEHRIAASGGNWGKLPDPFDAGWRALMERTLQTELKPALSDPWCLGFFVDNELHWGDTLHLGEVTLASPAEQPAKQVFVQTLKARYPRVADLNAAWGTSHASWEALLAGRDSPNRQRPAVRADFEAFSAKLLDQYFRLCREAVKGASPNHLYLGARFSGGGNPLVMSAAARYCDVVSINRYTPTILDLALPAGVQDRPIVIGEFHFGAVDAAPFGIALLGVANQQDRARAYVTYLESALRNPAVIGTHWFQFFDQPATGRFDGENYNTGLVDGCDTPYREMVDACRRTAAQLYEFRQKAAVAAQRDHRR